MLYSWSHLLCHRMNVAFGVAVATTLSLLASKSMDRRDAKYGIAPADETAIDTGRDVTRRIWTPSLAI
jgi:hypothetical protein